MHQTQGLWGIISQKKGSIPEKQSTLIETEMKDNTTKGSKADPMIIDCSPNSILYSN